MITGISRNRSAGFTLAETMIASGITILVLASAMGLFFFIQRTWHETAVREAADHTVSTALNRMIYGVGGAHRGLRSSGTVTRSDTANGWRLNLTREGGSAGFFEYRSNDGTITYQPPNGGSPVPVADSILSADATLRASSLDLSIQAAINRGRFSATRQLNTTVSWRN